MPRLSANLSFLRGLYAAMTAAFYVFLKYAKLYERRLKSRTGL